MADHSSRVASPGIVRVDPEEQAHHDRLDLAYNKVMHSLRDLPYRRRRDALLEALGSVLGLSLRREQAAITPAIEVIIGAGGSRPAMPGLIEATIRERVKAIRTQGTLASRASPRERRAVHEILRILNGLPWEHVVPLLLRGVAHNAVREWKAGALPPGGLNKEVELLVGVAQRAPGQFQANITRESKR